MRARFAGPSVLALAFVALTEWSWRKWPDVLVDFGHELYVPWQLTSGRVLYRDLAFLYGPFSQYLNALWFRLFGVSLTTLIVCNLAILALLAALVYRLMARACDRVTAVAAAGALLGIFGFSQYVRTGNYNFVCPYSHEATHGTVLATAMIACFGRYGRRPGLGVSGLAGLALGLALLTRAEVGAAATVAAVMAMALLARVPHPERRWNLRATLALMGGVLLPVVVTLALFSRALPPAWAARATFGAWSSVANSAVTNLPFFVLVMGMDYPKSSLTIMLIGFLTILVTLAVVAGLDRAARRRQVGPKVIITGSVLVFVLLVRFPVLTPFQLIVRALPAVVLCTIGALLVAIVRMKRRRDPSAVELIPLIVWATFGFVLLGKIVLNARVQNYGFYLAMPGVLSLVGLVTWAIPGFLRARYGSGRLFRAVALAFVAAAIVYHLRWSDHVYRAKQFAVGRSGDTIVDYAPQVLSRGVAVARALQQISSLMRPSDSFAAIPEGVTLNYLARRVNPTPYTTLMPTELAAFGEATILEAFRAHPPDFIVLVHKDTREFGVGYFGQEPRYGKAIMDWVRRNYRTVDVIQHEPLQDDRFGIAILRRIQNHSVN